MGLSMNVLKSSLAFDLVLTKLNLFSPEPLYKVICPFHQDVNASMQINRETKFWYCYGCHAKGSTLELIKYSHPDWTDFKCISYITKLCKNKGIEESNEGEGALYNIYNNTNNTKHISFVESIKDSKNYYDTLPPVNWYKPCNSEANGEEAMECRRYMKKRGFTSKLLKECGAKPSLNKYYPICIPLLENGKFMGYVMRTFDKEIEAERKYMYNRGFKRERTLAGRFTKNEALVVVEGYLDCLKAQQFGVKNAAALLGWKMSQTQLKKVKKYNIPLIICATDNDEAGDKGYKYLLRLSKIHGFKVERLKYPKGIKDFGDLKKNEDKLQLVLNQIKRLGGKVKC